MIKDFLRERLRANSTCPLCKGDAFSDPELVSSADGYSDGAYITPIECYRCNRYDFVTKDIDQLIELSAHDLFKLSTFVVAHSLRRKDRIALLTFEDINPRDDHRDPVLVSGAIDRFPSLLTTLLDESLINLSFLAPEFGKGITLHLYYDHRVVYADSEAAMIFFLGQLVHDGLIFVSGVENREGKYVKKSITEHVIPDAMLTPKGWSHVAELQRAPLAAKPNQAFVAMWFDPSMKEVYEEAISRGIEQAGYDPVLINRKDHIGKIDDEIIAEIRKSKFVVADFTGQRGGVYYEAGFARGLGKSVISTCRADEVDGNKLHFDTRQYNHIRWERDKLPDFAQELKVKIEANLEHGANAPKN